MKPRSLITTTVGAQLGVLASLHGRRTRRTWAAALLACSLAVLGACADDTAPPPRPDGKTADHRAGDAPVSVDRALGDRGALGKADLPRGDRGAKPDQKTSVADADETAPLCPGQGTSACVDANNKPGRCWAGSCCSGCYDGFAKKCYPPSNDPAFCGTGGAACQVCTGTCVSYTCQ
jgi:hypothetical protein